MPSLVKYAVLFLVAQKQDYAAMIGRRMEERFGSVLRSHWNHAHPVLRKLEREGLVEAVTDAPLGSRRQPKTPYRITPAGRRCLHDWLVSPITLSIARREFLTRLLCIEEDDEATARVLLEVFEVAVTAEAERQHPEDGSDPLGALFRRRERGDTDAALEFIRWARRDLEAPAGAV